MGQARTFHKQSQEPACTRPSQPPSRREPEIGIIELVESVINAPLRLKKNVDKRKDFEAKIPLA
jgi:hypothetical protein